MPESPPSAIIWQMPIGPRRGSTFPSTTTTMRRSRMTTGCPREHEILEEAVRELCIERGYVTASKIQNQIDAMESRTPSLGANLVARAWTDAAFHRDVMDDAKAAADAIGIDMSGSPAMQAVQNTHDVHHMVVCTLCSCYPRLLLGVPPAWYKSRSYRARAVVDPRGVLAEFGTILPETMDIRVVDSTADLRYVVIPTRPEGTENWSATDLAGLVTRDSMIGVTPALARSTAIASTSSPARASPRQPHP